MIENNNGTLAQYLKREFRIKLIFVSEFNPNILSSRIYPHKSDKLFYILI